MGGELSRARLREQKMLFAILQTAIYTERYPANRHIINSYQHIFPILSEHLVTTLKLHNFAESISNSKKKNI